MLSHLKIIIIVPNSPTNRRAGNDDDSRSSSRGENLVHQQLRQQKMTNMIRPKLGLNAVLGLSVRASHDSSIIVQKVDLRNGAIYLDGCIAD